MVAGLIPYLPLARLDLRAAGEILALAMVIYFVLRPLRAARALQIVVAIILLIVVYRGIRWTQFEMVEWLPATMLPYIAIALVVLYQQELRRLLARWSHKFNLARLSSNNHSSDF